LLNYNILVIRGEIIKITNIKVKNFKSFDNLNIDLEKLNVLIGANASGKSNFIDIFRFIRDVGEKGLDNAISLQGGPYYIKNLNNPNNQNLSIDITGDLSGHPANFGSGYFDISIRKIKYSFNIKFLKTKPKYIIQDEKLIFLCNFEKVGEGDDKPLGEIEYPSEVLIKPVSKSESNEKKLSKKGEIKLIRKSEGKYLVDVKPKYFSKCFPQSIKYTRVKNYKSKIIVDFPFAFLPFSLFLNRLLESVKIYDFSAKLAKKTCLITGISQLEHDGSNLAVVLKKIIEDKDKNKKFSNLVKDILPFINKFSVDNIVGKSLLINLKEKYSKDNYLPSFLLSDGTINIVALIIALYFEDSEFTIIEEPERNIHPSLMSKFMDMAKDSVSTLDKHILITTHNPEIVRNTDPNNLLFSKRDEKTGCSKIYKPTNKKEVKTFLENEIGIDELFVQNLLEW